MTIGLCSRMPRELHDHYFHEAKREGYRSRAAYKLIEIDERRKIIRRGDAVLDCGCAPGSWLQVAAARVGPRGCVVGIDLKPVQLTAEPYVHIVEGDIREIDPAEFLAFLPGSKTHFDVILSDMAPYTTGERTRDHHRSARLCGDVLDRCPDLLRPGGNVVMKVLEGETYPDLLTRTGACFDKVKGFKPKASRSVSTEMYIVAHGFISRSDVDPVDRADVFTPPPRPPSGWSN